MNLRLKLRHHGPMRHGTGTSQMVHGKGNMAIWTKLKAADALPAVSVTKPAMHAIKKMGGLDRLSPDAVKEIVQHPGRYMRIPVNTAGFKQALAAGRGGGMSGAALRRLLRFTPAKPVVGKAAAKEKTPATPGAKEAAPAKTAQPTTQKGRPIAGVAKKVPPPVGTEPGPSVLGKLKAGMSELGKKFLRAARQGKITSESKLGKGGINKADIIELKDDGKAVWKDARQDTGYHEQSAYRPGESPGDMEVAAYRVSKLLGLQHIEVPETTYVRKGGNIGSAQRFIDGAITAGEAEFGKGRVPRRVSDGEWAELTTLDYIIGNKDRHEGNWMYGDDGKGKCYAIDHGYSVPTGYAPGRRILSNLPTETRRAIKGITEQELRDATTNLQKPWQDKMWQTVMDMQESIELLP